MSLPTFPIIDPPLTREGSLNEIISSIAAEELSLSHILNAEGEKLQYVLGTLPGLETAAALDEVMQVNQSVQETLSNVMEQQMLLTGKLATAMSAPILPGPTGPTGLSVTATSAFAANTSGSVLNVALLGTLVPLPNSQVLSPDITVNGANTVFTVNTSGRYQLSYTINTTLALASGTRLLISNTPNQASTLAPLLSLSHFSNEILVDLNAGDTISLQMFGISTPTTLLPGASGATLSITRLS